MLKAYFDDSGTHSGSTVIAVGGFVAQAEEWDVFDRDWAEMLAIAQIGWFHMSACGSQHGEFTGWSKERCDALIKNAIAILKEHPLHGFAAGMLANNKKPTIPIGAFDMCLGQCISALLHRVDQLGERVEIFMEDHPGRKKHLLDYLRFRGEFGRHLPRGRLVESVVAWIEAEMEFALSPSRSVRRSVRTEAIRVRPVCSGIFGRPESP